MVEQADLLQVNFYNFSVQKVGELNTLYFKKVAQ